MFIAGFPGVGKTRFAATTMLNVYDVDSSEYSKLPNGQNNPRFIQDYFNHLTDIGRDDDALILTSTHKDVLLELKNREMDYYVVIPEEGLLDEYISRYMERGSSQQLIHLISTNWHDWLRDIKANHRYFELRRYQNLTDFMVETYELCQGTENPLNNVALKK